MRYTWAQYVSTSCSCTWTQRDWASTLVCRSGHVWNSKRIKLVTSGGLMSCTNVLGHNWSTSVWQCVWFMCACCLLLLSCWLLHSLDTTGKRNRDRDSDRERKERAFHAHFRRNFKLDFLLLSGWFKMQQLVNCMKLYKMRWCLTSLKGGKRVLLLGKFIRVSRRTLPTLHPLSATTTTTTTTMATIRSQGKRQQTKFSEAISMKFISHEDLSRFQTALATPANAYKCNLWLSRIMHTTHTHTLIHTHLYTHTYTQTHTQHVTTAVPAPFT